MREPLSAPRQRLGRWGEGVAATHLEAQGYVILAHNWRCAAGEIDLVARDGETVVFVEAKTRRGRAYGAPEEALTPRKAQKLLQLGAPYCYEHALDYANWRIALGAADPDARALLLRRGEARHGVVEKGRAIPVSW